MATSPSVTKTTKIKDVKETTQEGFLYEENAYAELEKYGISTGGTAGASHDKPDLTIKAKAKTTTGCELKNSPTAAGSLVMKYYNGKWDFGDYIGEPEKEMLVSIAKGVNLLREMNTSGMAGMEWRKSEPILQNDKLGKKKLLIGDISKLKDRQKAYAKDIQSFGGKKEIHIDVGSKAVCDYYITKKCSYINVGTHGFFTLNGQDDLGLNKKLKALGLAEIPDFSSNSKTIIRMRCQLKSKSQAQYQFSLTLQFSGVKKSPYNIAPIKRGTKSTIDVTALKNDSILLAFK
jgi:hypothetical protein